ncbi:MAG: hypothetical protein AAF806_16425 [Bacteroidota bacterium]
MTLSNILPSIQKLSLVDKIRLIGILAKDIQTPLEEVEMVTTIIRPDQVYYLHTPYNTFGAAEILMQAVEKDKTKN